MQFQNHFSNQLTLIGSYTSPYVRKLRMYLLYNLIPFEFSAINYLEKKDALFLNQISPINKIPILLIDQKPLYESRIIFQYLQNQMKAPKLTLDEENILSCLDEWLDTAINLFSLQRGGLDLNQSNNTYIERQKKRLVDIEQYLTPFFEKTISFEKTEWNFLTMSLYSFIDWAQFRNMYSLSHNKILSDFHRFYSSDEIAIQTRIMT